MDYNDFFALHQNDHTVFSFSPDSDLDSLLSDFQSQAISCLGLPLTDQVVLSTVKRFIRFASFSAFYVKDNNAFFLTSHDILSHRYNVVSFPKDEPLNLKWIISALKNDKHSLVLNRLSRLSSDEKISLARDLLYGEK